MVTLRSKKGITLLEIMITVVIMGILVVLIAPMITQGIRHFILSRTKIQLQQEARTSMALMTKYLREGQASTIVIDRAPTQPHYSRITFTKYTPSGAAAAPTQQQVTFYQSGTRLIHTVGTRTIVLSKNLRYVAFTFPRSDDMGIVSVGMTLEQGIYQAQTKALHMASEKVRVMN